jgi:hypothetical protein
LQRGQDPKRLERARREENTEADWLGVFFILIGSSQFLFKTDLLLLSAALLSLFILAVY